MKQVLKTIASLFLSSPVGCLISPQRAFSRYRFVLLLAGFALLMSSCRKEDFQSNSQKQDLLTSSQKQETRKQSIGPIQINFTEHNLFPEGVAYDPHNDWFYVSSAAHGTVGIVTFDGTYRPFITDETLTGTAGLKVDKAHKRLLVCNVENGLGAYDLNTGARIFYTNLEALLPGTPIFINDVALDPQGNAYVTNSFAPVIYKVDRDGNASVFFNKAAFTTGPGEFGFNGIQYNERGFLLVAFSNEIVKIPVRNPAGYTIVQLDTPISPDGLLLSKDGKQLIVVNNTFGTPDDKVLSFISNDAWKSGSLSTTFNTGPVVPTTATSDGKRVFVLYSHLDQLVVYNQDQDTFTIQEIPLKEKSSF